MDRILTWPAYGTWLPGPARGRVRPLGPRDPAPADIVLEPDRERSVARRRSLACPPVMLTAREREVVIGDLERIARLRRFALLAATVASDHVHVLFATDDEVDVDRLVQLIKGATSRALSVLAVDATGAGPPRGHRTWWTRQHDLVVVAPIAVDDVRQVLLDPARHPGGRVFVSR